MSSAVEEMTELTRELQKLSKELGPVKAALGALEKRERAAPNPHAAAASLERIAARVADVRAKYRPLMRSLGILVEHDVPAALQLTDLLQTPALQLEVAAREPRSGNSGTRNTAPSSVLADVCPDGAPHVVPPGHYLRFREELQLQVEIVDYLLATGRLEAARSAAKGYDLPLMWFPALAEPRRVASPPMGSPTSHPVGLSGTPPVGRAASLASPPASLRITPAAPPRTSTSLGGSLRSPELPPASPIQLPTPALGGSPESASGLPSRESHGPSPPRVATRAFMTETPERATPFALPPADRPHTPPRRSTRAGEPFSSSAAPMGSPLAGPLPGSPGVGGGHLHHHHHHQYLGGGHSRAMPDLVARVIAAGLMFKDEYMDRMVLERLVAYGGYAAMADERGGAANGNGNGHGGEAPRGGNGSAAAQPPSAGGPPSGRLQLPNPALSLLWLANQSRHLPSVASVFATAPHVPQAEGRRYSHLERTLFDQAVVETARGVSRARVCTQSASPAFDATMMGVVEELLATCLERLPAQRDSDKNKNGNEEAHEPPRRPPRLTAPLTPDDLLAAEDVFSSSVLFIKRPTRYYCAYAGKVMDGGGDNVTYPLALPNGCVVSQLGMTEHLMFRYESEGGQKARAVVHCPGSDTFAELNELRRIFAT